MTRYILLYLFIGVMVNMIGAIIFEYQEDNVWFLMLDVIAWPYIIIGLILYWFIDKDDEQIEPIENDIPIAADNKTAVRSLRCTRDAINYCDHTKETCCFECEDNDECDMYHCDEYDRHEYAIECPYCESVESRSNE